MAKSVDSWDAYYDATSKLPPRETLVFALDQFAKTGVDERLGLDLGCGEGRDTRELLRRGWQVLAIDKEVEAGARLRASVAGTDLGHLTFVQTSFDRIPWKACNLVNASYALQFCDPVLFPLVWYKLVQALQPGGRFAGHFLGPEDEWRNHADIMVLAEEEVRSLFEGFELELFKERREKGGTLDGPDKFWHVYSVVARKVAG